MTDTPPDADAPAVTDVRTRRVLDRPIWLPPMPAWLPLALFGFVLFVIARTIQQEGHAWGDDFALYINQARGLVEGTAWEVVAANRYAMQNSAFEAFTPLAYPWGTSLLLMPIIAIFGIDYSLLKLVPTLAFVAAALLFRLLAARRLPWLAAVILTLVVAFNPWFVWATDAVLSDLPFMALVFASIVALDRALDRGSFAVARHADLFLVGALIGASMHVRREGIGLLAALALAQVAAWMVRRRDGAAPWGWRAVATPWVSFVAVAGTVHLLFPAPIRGNVDVAGEPGLSQVRTNLAWYREPFAELAGLKRIGDNPIQAFGATGLGSFLVWTILVLAVIGALAGLARALSGHGGHDAVLAAAVVGMGIIVMMTPYHYQRYLYTLAPLVVLLAACGVVALVSLLRQPEARGALIVQVVVVAMLVPSTVDNVRQIHSSLRLHTGTTWVHRGPEDEPTQELWDAVRRYTDGRDVVVFFQARTMNLYTRRLSIVGNDEQMMIQRGDWYAMERDSDYLQTPLTDERAAEIGFVRVWENERYVLWEIPPRRAP